MAATVRARCKVGLEGVCRRCTTAGKSPATTGSDDGTDPLIAWSISRKCWTRLRIILAIVAGNFAYAAIVHFDFREHLEQHAYSVAILKQ